MFGKSPVLYTFSLSDDLCVDEMNKKPIIEVRKFFQQQGETKMKRRGCPLGKLLLEVTSPKV